MAEPEDDYFVPDVNLATFMTERMRQYGDTIALVDVKTNHSYTYAVVIDRIQRLAAGLRELGLRQGDVLCIVTFNHIDYPIVWFAVAMLGAALQTASPDYTDEDLERRFRQCETKFIITTTDQAQRIAHAISKLGPSSKPSTMRKIIVMGEADNSVSFDSLFTRGKLMEATQVDTKITTALLLSSSGTTGLPKNVRLTHRGVIANLPQLQEINQYTPGMCSIVQLPMFHHYGLIPATALGLYNGIKMVVMEKYVFEDYLAVIQRHKVDILSLVPPIAIRLIKYNNISKVDFSSVKFVQSGAASLGIETERQLLQLFDVKYIATGYGTTEAGVTSGCKSTKFKAGSCGVTPKGVKLKIVDPDTGSTLSANQTGEIRVGGPQITIGYLNEPEMNKVAFDSDGYFKTGDLGYMDADGFIHVVDRLKELIKYKGLQVAPAYLEDLLMKRPDLADAAVIGVPDDEAGELPKAFVVKQPNSSVTETDVINYIADHVASHMKLRGGVEFVAQIPKNASGKILRRLLRQQRKQAKL